MKLKVLLYDQPLLTSSRHWSSALRLRPFLVASVFGIVLGSWISVLQIVLPLSTNDAAPLSSACSDLKSLGPLETASHAQMETRSKPISTNWKDLCRNYESEQPAWKLKYADYRGD